MNTSLPTIAIYAVEYFKKFKQFDSKTKETIYFSIFKNLYNCRQKSVILTINQKNKVLKK